MWKRWIKWILSIIVVIGILIVLSKHRVSNVSFQPLRTLYQNVIQISNALYSLLPFLIIVIGLTFLARKKWAFRVERLSIGGFNVLFENPNSLFKRQVRTFLNTKRTLFKIDLAHDNFSETLDSYFETYKFLRDEIKMLGELKERQQTNGKTKREKEGVRLYKLANKMIRELNGFLTAHQSDFRRWYTYQEKYHNEDFYLKPIGKLQEDYGGYAEITAGFAHINKFFMDEVADVFQIDVEKWRSPDA